MTISEYIAVLERLRDEHGELSVQKYGAGAERIVANKPEIRYELILRGRERQERFWFSIYDQERQGRKVVCI